VLQKVKNLEQRQRNLIDEMRLALTYNRHNNASIRYITRMYRDLNMKKMQLLRRVHHK